MTKLREAVRIAMSFAPTATVTTYPDRIVVQMPEHEPIEIRFVDGPHRINRTADDFHEDSHQ